MAMILGDRVEGWQLDLIEPDGTLVETLPMAAGTGRHDWDTTRTNPGTMSAEVGGDAWEAVRGGGWLRGVYRCNGDAHVLGTWVMTEHRRSMTGTAATISLSGSDPTVLLSRTRLLQSLSCPAGTPIAETVRTLIERHAPMLTHAIGDTDETVRTLLGWDAGTPVLDAINALLVEAAVYSPLTPTRDGGVTSTRWVPYVSRSVVGVFDFGPDDLPFVPDVEPDDNLLSRPDQVVARGRGGQDAAGVVGQWPDYLVPGGLVETITTEAVDAPTAVLAARRHYEESRAESLSASLDGPWQPIDPHQIVRWRWPRWGTDIRAEVTGMSTRWVPSSPTTYQLRQVA